MRLASQIVAPSELTPAQRARMYILMRRHYAGVTRAGFEGDLDEKQWVLLLSDATNQVQGFTTMRLFEAEVDGERVPALFSGDTIIDRAYWGEPTLARTWAAFALSLADRMPDRRLYWFLISKGYRTYKFLPLYFKTYYPHPAHPTPPEVSRLMAALAERKFPGHFDRQQGILRFGPGKDRLRQELAAVEPHRLKDPHVRFFLERNPGFAQGDELVCLAEISRRNMRASALQRCLPQEA